MPDATSPSGSHATFFSRRKRSFLPQKSVPAAHDIDPDTDGATDSHRPSTAHSAKSSETLTPFISKESHSSIPERSASVRSPKGRKLGEALAARFEGKAATGSTRQFPPSAFLHRSRGSETVSDIYARELAALKSPVEQSPRNSPPSGATSPQASRRDSNPRLPTTPFGSFGSGGNGITRSMTIGHGGGGSGAPNSAQALCKHIHSIASKRISTLNYLRQVHEGNVYWFTTFQFSRLDFSKLPYFEPRKLARRATNYLILGISIPTILDPNSESATEYLRAFNVLLGEYETYQNLHSVDGHPTGSLGKGRFNMFRRATQTSGHKSRRTSNPAEPFSSSGYDSHDSRTAGVYASNGSASFSSFTSDNELLPGEEYNFLLTPFLPFEPDYFETFVTLCDVLTDCYAKIMGLVDGPEAIQPGVGELFAKADAKVKKLLISGLVHDFDEATKQGIKTELAGVAKVVLGGFV